MAALLFLLVVGVVCSPTPPLPTGCDIFHDNECIGDNTKTPDDFEDRRWQTPRKGDEGYLSSYQSMSDLAAFPRITYSDDRKSATVEIITFSRSNVSLTFQFGSKQTTEPVMSFDISQSKPLPIKVFGSGSLLLELDDVDFIWNAPQIEDIPQFKKGQKGAIVEFFGWPHKDVEQECMFLSKAGYLGAKLFPAHEQLMSDELYNGEMNPWYFMYQPVSYRLQGRMGTRDELRLLINTCRSLNVRVYADAVINHMTGNGNDARLTHRNGNAGCAKWANKQTSAKNSSPFYTQGFAYEYMKNTGKPPSQEYPAVPYGPTDFHCDRPVNSWTDPIALNAGWLVGLTDLDTSKAYVRQRIADYLTDLLGIGFSGFRIDAAKHIHPDDLAAIFGLLKKNLGGSFPEDFFTWLEIIIGGEAQLLMCNEHSGYNYGAYFTKKLSEQGLTSNEIDMIKIWNSGYPKEPDVDCKAVSRVRNLIQNDDHDQQNEGSSSRDMGDQGSVLVKDRDVNLHRGFETKLFNNPNGAQDNNKDFPLRAILSSYYFDNADNKVHGIPDGKSDCSLCKGDNCNDCKNVPFAPAFVKDACAYEGHDYTRVHRDTQIINAMRQWMGFSSVNQEELGFPNRCT